MYPNSNPEDMPNDDMNRMLALDEVWMTECVAVLPHDSIIRIANNVDRDVFSGE